jgi:transposase
VTSRTMFVDAIDRGAAATIVDRLRASTALMPVAQLRVLGGAMARVPAAATAFAHGDRRIMVTITAVYARAEETAVHEPWVTGFAAARHLASWAGMCPGNHESAGKRRSGRTRKGSPWLRVALTEAAHAAARTMRDTYLKAQYRRLAARRGKQRAIVAVGHTILVIVYHRLTDGAPYHGRGGRYFDDRDRRTLERRLVHRLRGLGYTVSLQPSAA